MKSGGKLEKRVGFAGGSFFPSCDFSNVKTAIPMGLLIFRKAKLHSCPTLKLPGINFAELLSIRQFQLTKLGGNLR